MLETIIKGNAAAAAAAGNTIIFYHTVLAARLDTEYHLWPQHRCMGHSRTVGFADKADEIYQ